MARRLVRRVARQLPPPGSPGRGPGREAPGEAGGAPPSAPGELGPARAHAAPRLSASRANVLAAWRRDRSRPAPTTASSARLWASFLTHCPRSFARSKSRSTPRRPPMRLGGSACGEARL